MQLKPAPFFKVNCEKRRWIMQCAIVTLLACFSGVWIRITTLIPPNCLARQQRHDKGERSNQTESRRTTRGRTDWDETPKHRHVHAASARKCGPIKNIQGKSHSTCFLFSIELPQLLFSLFFSVHLPKKNKTDNLRTVQTPVGSMEQLDSRNTSSLFVQMYTDAE